jgi:hypothetical protein
VAAVNSNDSDDNLRPDRDDSALADPDPDLVLLAPLGPACCPCPRHGGAEEPGAELVEHSGRVALWWDWEKTLPFSGNITRLQHVFAEGLAPSPHPWADRLVWRWEDGDGNRYHATNRLTLLNVSVWPDANADGETLPAWWGADSMLLAQSPGRVWPVAAASNVLRKVLLAAEVGPGVPGELILRADGPVRVWAEASADGAPLLDPPGGVTVHTFPARFTERGVYVEATAPGDAELAFEFDGREEGGFSGRERPARFRAVAKQTIKAWKIGIHSPELDANGFPVAVDGRAVTGAEIDPDESLSTYVPFDGGGAPDIESTSPRWVTFTAVTNAFTNCATLSMTMDDADGFKAWDMAFEGATVNGTSAWLWQGASNQFLRAECPTNAAGAMLPLSLTFLDTDFNGQTNAVSESFSLYHHAGTNGFWGSTYSITGPREEIGMPAFSANNAFIVRVPSEAGEALGDNPICEISVGEGDPV